MSEIGTRTSGYGLEVGRPDIRSVGPIAFGPDGILFVADNVSAEIFALDVGGGSAAGGGAPYAVERLDGRLAAYLGCEREDVHVRDMAVHPESGLVHLSVMRGAGSAATPVLVTVAPDGALVEVELGELPFAEIGIDDAPGEDDERVEMRVAAPDEPAARELEVRGITLRIAEDSLRATTITDLAYVDGALLVAGASNEEFISTLRRIPFPFDGEAQASSLEIFHVSHGKYETHSPIRSFVAYGGEASILATYTCTPIVRFSLDDIRSGARAQGRTVAELGAMNTPLDMVSYERGGEEYLLVANTRHPLLKLARRDVDAQEPLTSPTEPIGPPREELPHAGVIRMAAVDGQVLMLQHGDEGLSLRAYDAATL